MGPFLACSFSQGRCTHQTVSVRCPQCHTPDSIHYKMPSVPHTTSQLKKKGNGLKVKAEYDFGNVYEGSDDQMARAREDGNGGQEKPAHSPPIPLEASSTCGSNCIHGESLS